MDAGTHNGYRCGALCANTHSFDVDWNKKSKFGYGLSIRRYLDQEKMKSVGTKMQQM